ncbi:hypothetical protein BJ138DRAFT_1184128 [Hygrophoropsis aurantiaca]|uniref:Uncharacterized protein n=1 Tax=Hygrophoropsis aurantiaca TaxID=72124 RepID=A0ACB7ZVE6_9AGAM|nr:hypothetical protein BJ138DRAFT_1184128 [Hygrophoropsis aurantiaca]
MSIVLSICACAGSILLFIPTTTVSASSASALSPHLLNGRLHTRDRRLPAEIFGCIPRAWDMGAGVTARDGEREGVWAGDNTTERVVFAVQALGWVVRWSGAWISVRQRGDTWVLMIRQIKFAKTKTRQHTGFWSRREKIRWGMGLVLRRRDNVDVPREKTLALPRRGKVDVAAKSVDVAARKRRRCGETAPTLRKLALYWCGRAAFELRRGLGGSEKAGGRASQPSYIINLTCDAAGRLGAWSACTERVTRHRGTCLPTWLTTKVTGTGMSTGITGQRRGRVAVTELRQLLECRLMSSEREEPMAMYSGAVGRASTNATCPNNIIVGAALVSSPTLPLDLKVTLMRRLKECSFGAYLDNLCITGGTRRLSESAFPVRAMSPHNVDLPKVTVIRVRQTCELVHILPQRQISPKNA